VADPGGGPDQWQYSGGGGLAYYIDPSFGAGGDGSYASPWDDFTEVNALTGDLGGRIIRLKSGQTIYDAMRIANASNWSIETYGGSTKAIIDGSVLSGWTWTNVTGDIWSTPGAGVEQAVWVGDLAFERANNGQTNPVQSVMDRCEATFWWGTHSVHGGGNLLWVHAPAGMDMNAEEAANRVRTTSIEYCLRGDGCSGVTLRDIQVQRSHSGNVLFYSHGAGFTADGLLSRQVGKGATGQNCMKVAGVSAGVPATEVYIRNSEFSDNYGGGNNNGLEVEFIDGMTVEDCLFQRILGNGIEYWQTMKNTRVTRNRFFDMGNSAYWAANTSSSDHRNNQIDNNIAVILGTYTSDHASNGGGRMFARIQASSNTSLYHNTVITNAANVIRLEKGTNPSCTNTVTIKNNVFIDTAGSASGAGYRIQTLDSGWVFVPSLTGASNEIVSDYNQFYTYHHATPSGANMGYINAVGTVGLAAWQAQSGSPDANSSEANPLLTSMLGTTGVTTTLSATSTSDTYTFNVADASGFSVGDRIMIPMTLTPRIFVARIASISGNTITTTVQLNYNSCTSGAVVTQLIDFDVDMTPAATPPLDSGVGSATDSNIPTTDFNGNPRSTSTPDIGAVEV
jgi:hypothetical protein